MKRTRIKAVVGERSAQFSLLPIDSGTLVQLLKGKFTSKKLGQAAVAANGKEVTKSETTTIGHSSPATTCPPKDVNSKMTY